MQGSCASLGKSELGRNQLSAFGQTGRAILDCSLLPCETGGMKDLPRGAATCQEPSLPPATGAGADWGVGGRGQQQQQLCSAPPGPPARPGPRGQPGAAAAARGQRALPEVFPRGLPGARHGGSPPRIQYLGGGPQAGRGRGGERTAQPLAAPARRASRRAGLAHRWAGMGGACAPGGAWEDPGPPNLPKNSLPPGRLPGLLPFPTPCGP